MKTILHSRAVQNIMLFAVYCLLMPANAFSQGTWQWAKSTQNGTSLADTRDVYCDGSGNVYVTGQYQASYISFGNNVTLNSGSSTYLNTFVAKYDASGNILWAKTAKPNQATLWAAGITADASGNVYVIGTYSYDSVSFGPYTLPIQTGIPNQNVYMVKYDANGNELWANAPISGGIDEGYDVDIDPSGNIYWVGSYQTTSFTYGSNTINNPTSGLAIIKTNPSGNFLGTIMATSGGASMRQIAIDGSGNIYGAGSFVGSVAFGSTVLTQNSSAAFESFVVKFSTSGNALWAKQSYQPWKCEAINIAVNNAGTMVYVLGRNHSNSGPVQFGSITLPQIGFWDTYLMKYDGVTGNELCGTYMTAGAGDVVYPGGVAVDNTGDVYTVGLSYSPFTIGPSYSVPVPGGSNPLYLIVFDSNCTPKCKDPLPEGGETSGGWGAISADNSGNAVAIAGGFQNTMQLGSTNLVSTSAGADAWVGKYVKCGSTSLAVNTASTNILCNGQCTGTGTANPSGGANPYTYSWNISPTQNTQTATGLCSGNYSVLVTDATGNSATANVTITQPAALTAAATATASSCGSNNGSAGVMAGGGTPAYTYNWAPSGGNSSSSTGLSAGNYTCTITDSKGCTKTTTVTITSSGGPAVTTSATPQTCTQGGNASASASGGTVPYTYQWCNGQTTSTVSNLSAGSCTVTVTDAGGCSTIDTVNIITSGNIPTASVTSTSAFCGNNNGTATATVSGGTPPYTYSWSPSGQTTSSITNLAGGSYTVIVTDAGGCTIMQTENVSQSSVFTATTTAIASACGNSNGAATVNVTGGTLPHTYLWSGGQTTSTATGLAGGTYTITITDANGCTQTATAVVTSTGGPTAAAASNVTITQGQNATLTASGGGNYIWSNGSTQNPIIVSPSTTTVYCVTVTDATNCSDTACVTATVNIEQIPCGNVFIPNAFSPNADNENDIFYVHGNCISEMNLVIYNRWGQKIFESNGQSKGWDGMFNHRIENTGVYVWLLNATLSNGGKINRKGNVNLIR